MNLSNPPELADGGYWYVVPAVTETLEPAAFPDNKTTSVGEIKSAAWCCWFFGDYAALRAVAPITGIEAVSQATVQSILANLGHANKPFARAGGA